MADVPEPTVRIAPNGRLVIAVGDDFAMTINPTSMNNSRAWLVIHPERGFLRGFDNPDRANAYAQKYSACLVSVHVAADHLRAADNHG